jgi:hypothetical protein
MTPDDVAEMRAYLTEHGASDDFDIVVEGESPGDDPQRARELVASWAGRELCGGSRDDGAPSPRTRCANDSPRVRRRNRERTRAQSTTKPHV